MDGGSNDRTVDLVRAAHGVELVQTARGRGLQLNAGAARAHSEVLLFLHADTSPPDHACDRIRAALADPRVTAGCFRLLFDTTHPLLSLYAKTSAIDSVFTTFGDQAYFVRAKAFRDVGGFPAWPFLEDVELRLRLKPSWITV